MKPSGEEEKRLQGIRKSLFVRKGLTLGSECRLKYDRYSEKSAAQLGINTLPFGH